MLNNIFKNLTCKDIEDTIGREKVTLVANYIPKWDFLHSFIV